MDRLKAEYGLKYLGRALNIMLKLEKLIWRIIILE